jgi:hypothetical protein
MILKIYSNFSQILFPFPWFITTFGSPTKIIVTTILSFCSSVLITHIPLPSLHFKHCRLVTNHIHRSTIVQEQNEQLGVKFHRSSIYITDLKTSSSTCRRVLPLASFWQWALFIFEEALLIVGGHSFKTPSILSLQYLILPLIWDPVLSFLARLAPYNCA